MEGATESVSLAAVVLRILRRFSRPYDPNERALTTLFEALEAGTADEAACSLNWQRMMADVLSTPSLFAFLFPEILDQSPELEGMLVQLHNRRQAGPARQAAVGQAWQEWVGNQQNLSDRESLATRLMADLLSGGQGGSPFLFLSRYYAFRDLLAAYFIDPDRVGWMKRCFDVLYRQRANWSPPYCNGYAYQGHARLGICGIKPTEERLSRYGLDRWLRPESEVLDIGANCGFLAIELARSVAAVHGIEFNPYLVELGRDAAARLDQRNCVLDSGDFLTFDTDRRYDAVLSLANHCTIDGKLSMRFEDYVAKVWHLLRPEGMLFFESHNVFGPGTGGAGDDGDLDAKFDVVERYFEVVAWRMTRTYVPFDDIDKLFVVLRKRPYDPAARRVFSLPQAIRCYELFEPG